MRKSEEFVLKNEYVHDSERCRCTVRSFSPVIDEKERERRMEEIKKETGRFMAEVYRLRMEEEKRKQAE